MQIPVLNARQPVKVIFAGQLTDGMVVKARAPKAADAVFTGVWFSPGFDAMPRRVSEVRLDPQSKPHQLVQFFLGKQMVICGANRLFYLY